MVSTWNSPFAAHTPWSTDSTAQLLSGWRRILPALIFACLFGGLPLVTHSLELAEHPSPYLRDHAADPIRWRAPEAGVITEAVESGKPLLVSSGYLACYWCYRLKQDTFSEPRLAALVNKHYLPVLLDREMHGADDRRLQAFMQQNRGFGGWPAVAILTPAGEPVQAWNYLPAAELRGALQRFADHWREDADAISRQVAEANAEGSGGRGISGSLSGDTGALLAAFLRQTAAVSDVEMGGFGRAEKYPDIPRLQSLLDLHQLNPGEDIAKFIDITLNRMLDGDLLDPVEGGVFRYTENRDWSAPHFEQMLYTQALLSRLLIRAAGALGKRRFAVAGTAILHNMLQRFGVDGGWLAASLSAVGSDGGNGSYYLQPERDIASALGDNWKSLVKVRLRVEDRIMVEPVGPLAEVTRQSLVSMRSRQDLPRDDKRLLSWNGLALSALAHAAPLDPAYHRAAGELADEIMSLSASDPLPLMPDSPLDSPTDLAGYVYAAGGLLDWWQVSGDAAAVERVAQLLDRAAQRFYDGNGWRQGGALVLADRAPQPALPDSQLPSPSAEWLRLADALGVAGIDLPGRITDVAGSMASAWPLSLEQDAFFHATLISALVTRQFLGIH
jgi:uncharacterized protein YyaL (SSP411 family)